MQPSWVNRVKFDADGIAWHKSDKFPVTRVINIENASDKRLAGIVSHRMLALSGRRITVNKPYFSIEPKSSFDLVITIGSGSALDEGSYIGVHLEVLPIGTNLRDFVAGRIYHDMPLCKYLNLLESYEEENVKTKDPQEGESKKKKKAKKRVMKAGRKAKNTADENGCLQGLSNFVREHPLVTFVVFVIVLFLIVKAARIYGSK